MLVLVLCVVALITPAFFGGKLSRLAYVRFRAWWVLVVALGAQILIIEVFPEADRVLLEAIHIATYVAAGAFVAINWRIPGLVIIAAGGAMNGITIALNGGQLPASRPALEMAGIEVAKGEFINSGVIKDPVLPIFGDIFVWPEPFPFANVFSFGDVLIVIGVFYGAHKIAGSRLVKKPWVLPADVQQAEPAGAEHSATTKDLEEPALSRSDEATADSASAQGDAPRPKSGPRHAAPRSAPARAH